MTIEQLEKRRDICEKQISSAEQEKEKVEKQIEELVVRETNPEKPRLRIKESIIKNGEFYAILRGESESQCFICIYL